MNQLLPIVAAGVVLLLIIAAVTYLLRRGPKQLDQTYYQQRWQDLQKLCKDKATWPLAIIDADKLLEDALKRRRYKGKTMGERLVAAQRDITSNDEVWFGHKLRNRLVHETNVKLTKPMVKEALVGIRGALKDLGAL